MGIICQSLLTGGLQSFCIIYYIVHVCNTEPRPIHCSIAAEQPRLLAKGIQDARDTIIIKLYINRNVDHQLAVGARAETAHEKWRGINGNIASAWELCWELCWESIMKSIGKLMGGTYRDHNKDSIVKSHLHPLMYS